MNEQAAAVLLLSTLAATLAYGLGQFLGAAKQRSLWQDHMDKCNRYAFAVDDLNRWCAHTSPHAKLIARHLRAHGEGLGCNAGTPVNDEPCSVAGLREQLSRLDADIAATQGDAK